MKERGMIFNGEMVRALLEGRKTQTRLPVNPQPELTAGSGFSWKGWVYGSGSSDRETNKNFAHAANQAAAELSEKGFTVLNPATLPNGLSQPQYMDICCAMLRCADKIFMLSHWDQSEGARAEHALAKKLGLTIVYEGRPVEYRAWVTCRCKFQPLLISSAPGEMPRCAGCGKALVWGEK